MMQAVNLRKSALIDMRVYLRRRDRCVAQHLLDGADVSAMREQM